MSYGITDNGLIVKRLADIKEEIETSLKAELGAGINLDARSPLGQLVGIFAAAIASQWELDEQIYNSEYPDTAEGASLDDVASITNITRLASTKSKATARVTGTALTPVPLGFIASVSGNTAARFENTETKNLSASGINEVQDIDFSAVPVAGDFKLRYGTEETTALAFGATNTDVQNALNALPSLSDVVVTGNFTSGFTVTFQGADGQKDHALLVSFDNTLSVVITIVETVRGWKPYADVAFEAQTAGAVQAPAHSLTVIETPISGLDAIENLLDAELGRETETDTELRDRRTEQLQKAGTATIEGIRNNILEVADVDQAKVFENDTDVTDIYGRPPHSFESVVDGGINAAIAQAIFEAKAAGIATHGTITVVVTDSQNISHDIKFSRPTLKEIWMIVNIVPRTDPTEGELYPADGDAQVEAAVLAYATNFAMGQDVVTNLFYTPINTVQGVIGIEVLIGFTDPPTSSANLPIAPNEIAKFDSTRIVVNS
jgi:uncharacterized phage protein gp47/JayE